MKQIEIYAFLSNALQALDTLKVRLEELRKAVGNTIEWDSMD